MVTLTNDEIIAKLLARVNANGRLPRGAISAVAAESGRSVEWVRVLGSREGLYPEQAVRMGAPFCQICQIRPKDLPRSSRYCAECAGHTFKCLECSKTFRVPIYRATSRIAERRKRGATGVVGLFCSRACSASYRAKHPKDEPHGGV